MAAVLVAGCSRPVDLEVCLERCGRVSVGGKACGSLCKGDCDELELTHGVDPQRCRELQRGGSLNEHEPSAPRLEGPDPIALTAECGDWVLFVGACGIGRPEPDPTLDAAAALALQLRVDSMMVAQCEKRRMPFDPELIACFAAERGDCVRYKSCVDRVLAAGLR